MIAGDGPDRERLEALAARHGLNGRVRFAGRVSTEELAALYATCRAVYYAPVDEDYGMVPYEAFLSEKPVVTMSDAGGPLDVVYDRRHRARRRASRPGARGRVPLPHRARGRRARVGPGREGRGRAGHLGPRDRAPARMKVAYYSPMPPETSGIADYSALLLPGAARADRRRGGQARPHEAAAATPTSRSTTSATRPRPTAGSSTRCAGAAASSSCTSSCSTT